MSSAEAAPFGAVFVCRGASCSRRGRVSAAFYVRRVFILRPRFSVLDDELGRVGLLLSASISGPGRTWPRPVGRGSCCAARGIHSRPVIRGAWFVSCGASAFDRGPWASMRLPRYWVELADLGLEFGQVLARARRSVGRGAWFAGLRARAVGRDAWFVSCAPRAVGRCPGSKKRPLV